MLFVTMQTIDVLPEGQRHLADCVVIVDDETEFRCSSLLLHRSCQVFRDMLSTDLLSKERGQPRLAIDSNGFSLDALREALVALHSNEYPEAQEDRMAMLGPFDYWGAELSLNTVAKLTEGLDCLESDHARLINTVPTSTRRLIIDVHKLTSRFSTQPMPKDRIEGLARVWDIASFDAELKAAVLKISITAVPGTHIRSYLETERHVSESMCMFVGRLMVEQAIRSIAQKRKRHEQEMEDYQAHVAALQEEIGEVE